MRGTIAAIERRLLVDGFVKRYESSVCTDGLPPGEGAFLACSFWLADNMVLQGRHDDARELFGRLLDIRNDVGLLAEQYDPRTRRQLGNFPQAFSHFALANTARNLMQAETPAQQCEKGSQATDGSLLDVLKAGPGAYASPNSYPAVGKGNSYGGR